MSSIRVGSGALALIALLLAPAAAAAQQSDEELVARIEALIPLVERARDEARVAVIEREERARRFAESQGALDTLRLHDMTIIAPTEDVDLARELFEEVWTEHFRLIESRTLRRWVFTFQTGGETREIFVASDARPRHITLDWWQSRRDAVAIITSAVAHAISRDISDTRVGLWVSDDPLRAIDPGRVYRNMATTPSQSVRRCLEGVTQSCLASFDLGAGDPSIATWYAPEERRNLIVSGNFRPGPREEPAQYSACKDDRAYEACDALLLAKNRSWAPLPGPVRAALLGFALDRGGEGAWARLVEKRNDPVEEALAYSAGVDLDALIVEWHRWIVDNRPETYSAIGTKSVLAALWILFFAALAMRSTRWRLG